MPVTFTFTPGVALMVCGAGSRVRFDRRQQGWHSVTQQGRNNMRTVV